MRRRQCQQKLSRPTLPGPFLQNSYKNQRVRRCLFGNKRDSPFLFLGYKIEGRATQGRKFVRGVIWERRGRRGERLP
jgi:hypothetical protein